VGAAVVHWSHSIQPGEPILKRTWTRLAAFSPLPFLLLLALAAGHAGAQQVGLVAAYPSADSTHAAAVTEVRLRFSEVVQPKLTAITVLGPEGSVPPTGTVERVPSSPGDEVSIHFAHPLGSGAYTIEWRTAGQDGQVVRGAYLFSIALPSPTAPAAGSGVGERAPGGGSPAAARGGAAAPSGAEFGPGGLTLNWLFLLSIIGMIGTVAFRLGVVAPLARREDLEAVSHRIGRRLVRLAWAFAIIGVVVLPLRLGYQATLLVGPNEGLFDAAGILLGSLWGSAWLLEVASVALFMVAILLMGPSPRIGPWGLALTAALLGSVVPGLSGHAIEGGLGLLGLNTLHVLAAGTWAGGLVCLVFVGIPAAHSEDPDSPALSVLVASFSRVALPAVGILALSGIGNALSHVAFGQFLTTPYGRLVSVKLFVVLGAFSLGFYNWRMVRPALEGRSSTGLLSVPATLELVAALSVLAVTAALAVARLP
jgi:putative copper export protein